MAIPLASPMGEFLGCRAGPCTLMRVKTQKSFSRRGHHLCFAGGGSERAQAERNGAPLLHRAQGSGKREPDAVPRSPARQAPRKCMSCVLAVNRSIWNCGFQAENTGYPHERPCLAPDTVYTGKESRGKMFYRSTDSCKLIQIIISGFCGFIC